MGSLGLNRICYRTARLDFTDANKRIRLRLGAGSEGRSQIEIIDSNGQTTEQEPILCCEHRGSRELDLSVTLLAWECHSQSPYG